MTINREGIFKMEEKEFLRGQVLIKVSSREQSLFLIELAMKNGINVEYPFNIRTYVSFPYYFVEGQEQINAAKWEDLDDLGDSMKIKNFDECFSGAVLN